MAYLEGNSKKSSPTSSKKVVKKQTPAPRAPVTIAKSSGQRQPVGANAAKTALAAAQAAATIANAARQAAPTQPKQALQPTPEQQAKLLAFNTSQALAPSYSVGGSNASSTAGAQTSSYTPPPAPIPEITTATAAPAQATPQTTTASSNAPSNVGAFTTVGGGGPTTFGQFQRQRLNRGPRTGLSITPELLRRIAAQRLSRS